MDFITMIIIGIIFFISIGAAWFFSKSIYSEEVNILKHQVDSFKDEASKLQLSLKDNIETLKIEKKHRVDAETQKAVFESNFNNLKLQSDTFSEKKNSELKIERNSIIALEKENSGLKEGLKSSQEKGAKYLEDLNKTVAKFEKEASLRVALEKQNATDSANLKSANATLKTLKENKEEMLEKFESLSARILKQQSSEFSEQQQKGLKSLLTPLSEKIQTFEKTVGATHKESLEKTAALKEQIRNLSELNTVMSEEAKNLTNALKGDNKTQGTWGEIVLERILEKSGLEKDREYFIQQTFNSENGRQRPDVVIQTPDEKYYIIDSKVSLKAYEQFTSSTDLEEQQRALKTHTRSIRAHIDGLAGKSYEDLYKVESPDFVFMFVPIETAFTCSLHADSSLYDYAFEKNIIIVTNSTLLATLKTIDSMWRNEKQTRNAMEIATEAGKMLDKFANFVEDLEGIGKRIDQTKKSYDDSMNKLTSGTGDLITRAKKIEALGAKANKPISPTVLKLAEENA